MKGTFGIGGESGSSLIHVVNNEEYTSYGVGTWSYNTKHSRFENWQYYAIRDIIKDDLNVAIEEIPQKMLDWKVFPNPAHDMVSIHLENMGVGMMYRDYLLKIVSVEGKLLMNKYLGQTSKLDVSNYPSGLYILNIQNIETGETFNTKLIIE